MTNITDKRIMRRFRVWEACKPGTEVRARYMADAVRKAAGTKESLWVVGNGWGPNNVAEFMAGGRVWHTYELSTGE